MTKTTRKEGAKTLPSWGLIGSLVVIGIVLVGFGNADRVFWRLTSQGAQMPGIVTEVRSYRPPDSAALTYVPKVAFRDDHEKLRILEPSDAPTHYPFKPNQRVLVDWRKDSETITVDLPLQRGPVTSTALWLLTAVGLSCWAWGSWLILRRIILKTIRVGE